MYKFIYRLKNFLFHRKEMSWYAFYGLTMMDIGRWFFKKAHNCNKCGSLNVVGYVSGIGLHCPNCIT